MAIVISNIKPLKDSPGKSVLIYGSNFYDFDLSVPQEFHLPLNNDLIDKSPNNYYSYAVNKPSYVSGKIGNSIELEGTVKNQHIVAGIKRSDIFNVPNLDIAFWFYLEDLPMVGYDQYVFYCGTQTDTTTFCRISNNGKLYFGRRINSDPSSYQGIESITTFQAKTWYHIVCRYDVVALSSKIFVNGVEDAVLGTLGALTTGTENLSIGSYFSGGINTTGFFKGRIDDFRIINTHLSQQEIDNIALLNPDVIPHLFLGSNEISVTYKDSEKIIFTVPGVEKTFYEIKVQNGFSLAIKDFEVIEPWDFSFDNQFFEADSEQNYSKSIASDLPDGKAWEAKNILDTVIYALVWATMGSFALITALFEKISNEFNLYKTEDLISTWENSVGLPDPRKGNVTETLDERRKNVKLILRKYPIVTLKEFQDRLDEVFPHYGIWIEASLGGSGGFRYDLRLVFSHGGGAGYRFKMYVHIPWLAIDPLDLDNSPLTWDNLLSWFKDFVPAYITLIPVYEPQASYCVVTHPRNDSDVYCVSDKAGGWNPITVNWKQIDIDGTVKNHSDIQIIDPSTDQITRTFTDSTSSIISDTNTIRNIVLL